MKWNKLTLINYVFVFSCVIATSASFVSQKISNIPKINSDSLLSYGLFGLIFGGPLPHYFYGWMEHLTMEMERGDVILKFLGERVILQPIMVALSLYFLTRFEGRSHDDSVGNLMKMYKSVLLANWKYLSIPMLINFKYIPIMVK